MRARLAVCFVLVTEACLGSPWLVRRSEQQKLVASLPSVELELTNGVRAAVLASADVGGMVEIDVRLDVGSRDDPAGKTGLALLVQHLWAAPRSDEVTRPSTPMRLHALTPWDRARTTPDVTEYTVLVDAGHLDDVLAIQASRLARGCAEISTETLDHEIAKVAGARRRPAARLLADLHEGLYPPGHPYGHAPFGREGDLASVTLFDVCAFMRENYRPDRTTIVVAGDVDPDRVRTAVARNFGPIPARRGRARAPVPPVTAAPRTVTVERTVERPIVVCAWPIPAEHRQGQDLLWLGLDRIESQLRTRSFGGAIGGRDAPMVVYGVELGDDSRIDRTRDYVARSLEDVSVIMASERSLEVLRSGFAVAVLIGLDGLAARATTFAEWKRRLGADADLVSAVAELDHHDERGLAKFLAQTFDRNVMGSLVIRPAPALAPAFDVAAADPLPGAARMAPVVDPGLRYLNPSATPFSGLIDGDGVGKTPVLRRVDFTAEPLDDEPIDPREAEAPVAVPKRGGVPAGTSFTLENGLRVHLVAVPSGLPLVSVRLAFPAGWADETAGREGLATIAAEELSSVASFESERRYRFESRIEVTADRTSFELRGLNLDLEVMLAHVASRIVEGGYSQGSIRRLDPEPPPPVRARELFADDADRAVLGALFGPGHPYADPGRVTAHTYRVLDSDDVLAFEREHYVGATGVLVVAGAFDVSRARRSVTAMLGRLPSGHIGARRSQPAEPLPPSELGILGKAGATVPVRMGWTTQGASDSLYPVRLVVAQIMNERMRFVREKLGASYGASARLVASADAGGYVVSAEVDADRAPEVLKAMRADVAALRAGGVTAEELVRARAGVIRGLVGDATSTKALAARLEDAALAVAPLSTRDDLARRVGAVVLADVRRQLASELAADREVVVVGGPKELIEATFAGR